jgi:hypothetical protein
MANSQRTQPRSGDAKTKPVHEVRLGRVKAAIWANETDNGTRHNVTIIVERPLLYRDRLAEEPAKLQFETLALADVVATEAPEDIDADLRHHGDRFIRAALHLQYRAKLAGVATAPSATCLNRELGLSHAGAYQRALGSEPSRFACARLHDLLATPAPEAFTNLWASDLAHHLLTSKESV